SSTWGGGLTDMVRSRRFIELIVEHGYCQNAHERGEQIKAGLRRIAKDTNKFTSVRGEGTLLAFDFANGEQRGEMLKKLYDHKVLGLPCGDKTVRLRTPLSMEADEADEVLNRIEAAAGAVDSGSCCGCC
ncbi:MAG: aminotransferase class III-fold pyridoxal phosphate-dependent enzyme, partial [Planctomycetota bacterium]|nr:aminotransferase class III-fold pyridoxal phosphate-dependent enzyme [Planctomycetota bacterium]